MSGLLKHVGKFTYNGVVAAMAALELVIGT
jgi:hypothetical protein